ncbi:MAG TPA: outer membrane protein assembly factor BamD [Bacteroidia bacterium]|nr:outer membrane protein assembly factor BamD [Bacteroidia bacterium]
MFPRIAYILLIISVFASGCSNYTRVMKGTDMDAKLNLAIKLYNKGDYFKALPLLEELITVYRGTKKAEKTYYYYSYTNYQLGDYETAAYDFDNFAKTFPSSEYAEECAFMHSYCYYQDSPEYSLDQTNTQKAINELQLFADQYPQSTRIEQCNKLIDQLRAKLEEKNFQNARLYYNMEEYKAAVTTFKNLLTDFPSTQYREEAMFLILKGSYLLAENSIEDKKLPRFQEAVAAYLDFAGSYAESKYRKEADDIVLQARKRLEKLLPSSTSVN